MPQLVWCLGLIPVTMSCHYCATFISCQWSASYLENCFAHLEVYPWRCSSLPAKAMHSSGQHEHPWLSQTTVCLNWQRPACKHSLHKGALLKMGRQCGTVCQLHCKTVAYHFTHTRQLKMYLSEAWWTPSTTGAAFLRVCHHTLELLTYLQKIQAAIIF